MMSIKEGYVYHIKDSYFDRVQEKGLMQNKENGKYRPTFFCVRDTKEQELLWMVPLSTRYEKYQSIYNKQVKKYDECITIVLSEYDGERAAFLLQNMFPVTEKYLDHLHTRNNNPVPVKLEDLVQNAVDTQEYRQAKNKSKSTGKYHNPDERVI